MAAPETAEEIEMLKHLERSMKSWGFRVEEGDLSGLKIVPPLEIILVPDLIQRAWYRDRLIPWTPGFVEWETYLEYLKNFFYWNCGELPTLDDAIRQYLELEKKFVKVHAGVLCHEDLNLNERINIRIQEIREQQDTMSQDGLRLAAASFMCIAAETKMMSELTHSKLSNSVRSCALDLMFSKGSGCAVISAALLGMRKEATLMLDYMKEYGDNPDMEAEVSTCLDVRSRTLEILPILQRSYAHHTAGGDVVSHTEKSGSNVAVEVVNKPYANIEKKHLGKTIASKTMSGIGKTKELFGSLVMRSRKGSLHSSSHTSGPTKA